MVDNFREKLIWKWIRTQLPEAPKHIHLQRVEGVCFPLGFPDVMVYCNGRVGFLELKQHTKTRKIRLTPQQKLFLQKAKFFNIPAFVAVSDSNRSIKVLNPTPNLLKSNTFSDEDIVAEWVDAWINWNELERLFN